MHISEMIDNANEAVTNIAVVHGNVMMELMATKDFTPEQKVYISDQLFKISDAISIAQNKFSLDVEVK
ncbi:hypothetical protein K6Y31_20630 [Motilimonas cestriensis]|uniref:Histidine kinase n=1 Tax=Motilimonas cestriensis TaxID=2742685 RepID=A0ABS8WHH3_9GAMM|nr:hypothetical protein [Motilimonas cestriensis]MCE2597183.1 hypothetical protein [Motilimonas cestriensis]